MVLKFVLHRSAIHAVDRWSDVLGLIRLLLDGIEADLKLLALYRCAAVIIHYRVWKMIIVEVFVRAVRLINLGLIIKFVVL